MFFYIASVILLISLSALLLYTIIIIAHRNNKKKYNFDNHKLPKVSILKPVKNIDDEMELNFESFYELDYPDFEIIFGVNNLNDPCMEIINRVKSKYSNIETKVVETGDFYSSNPKITKLSMLEKYTEGEIYWVTDSNVRIEKETLKKLMNEYLTKNSKIVFSLIRGTGSKTLGSIIENSYINTFVSENIICSYKFFRQHVIVGKSMLIEKSSLETFGGFTYFRNYIAEDYMLGEAFVKSKFNVSTNYVWVTNINKNRTLKDFFSRIIRWGKIRFNMNKKSRFFYFLEILLNPIFLSLIFMPFLGLTGFYMFLGSILLKIFIEYLNLVFINFEDSKKLTIILSYPFAIIIKDFLLFISFFVPIFSNKINWRGSKYKIGKRTKITMD